MSWQHSSRNEDRANVPNADREALADLRAHATAAIDVRKADLAMVATDVRKADLATAAIDVLKADLATVATDVLKADLATAATDVLKADLATAAIDVLKADLVMGGQRGHADLAWTVTDRTDRRAVLVDLHLVEKEMRVVNHRGGLHTVGPVSTTTGKAARRQLRVAATVVRRGGHRGLRAAATVVRRVDRRGLRAAATVVRRGGHRGLRAAATVVRRVDRRGLRAAATVVRRVDRRGLRAAATVVRRVDRRRLVTRGAVIPIRNVKWKRADDRADRIVPKVIVLADRLRKTASVATALAKLRRDKVPKLKRRRNCAAPKRP
jgi:hypothetical protein